MKNLILLLSFVLTSFANSDEIAIVINSEGRVKINDYELTNSLNVPLLDSLIGKPSRIKQKRKSMPNLIIYDLLGIRAGSKPSVYTNEVSLRSFDLYYNRPFKSAPKLSFKGKFNIMGIEVDNLTTYNEIINDMTLSQHRIHYETVSDSASMAEYGYSLFNSRLEYLINETYIDFWYDTKDSTLISVEIDPFKMFVKKYERHTTKPKLH